MINIAEKLILGKNASKKKYNREIFKKYKQYFSCVSELLYYYQNPEKAEQESRCQTCGKKTIFRVFPGQYQKHCNLKCANNDPSVKKKIHDSNMRIGEDGLTHYQRGRIKRDKVILEKYGVDNIFKDSKRMKEIWQQTLGVDNPFKKESIKNKCINTCKKKYGVDWFSQTEKYKEKMISTKRRNHSFNKSEKEEFAYRELLKKFREDDIIRQYRSKEYPFACDFYIKSLDLYIECNFSWVHGKDGDKVLGCFDETNLEHIKLLNKWKEKKSKYYDNAIHIWTETDVKKLNTFKINKLNYKIFDDMNAFNQWYKSI